MFRPLLFVLCAFVIVPGCTGPFDDQPPNAAPSTEPAVTEIVVNLPSAPDGAVAHLPFVMQEVSEPRRCFVVATLNGSLDQDAMMVVVDHTERRASLAGAWIDASGKPLGFNTASLGGRDGELNFGATIDTPGVHTAAIAYRGDGGRLTVELMNVTPVPGADTPALRSCCFAIFDEANGSFGPTDVAVFGGPARYTYSGEWQVAAGGVAFVAQSVGGGTAQFDVVGPGGSEHRSASAEVQETELDRVVLNLPPGTWTYEIEVERQFGATIAMFVDVPDAPSFPFTVQELALPE